jgi:hypothetical protein
MTTLKEVAEHCARQLVAGKEYSGDVEHDSAIVADVIYRAVFEHNNQYNIRSTATKETQ